MSVLEAGLFRGPHAYSNTPMIRIMLDLGPLEEQPTNLIPGFADRLLRVIPRVGDHGCSLRKKGGFRTRLYEGTWLGHVAEHVALEMQLLVGVDVVEGKTRELGSSSGVYHLMYSFRDPEIGLLAGRAALELVNSLLPPGLRGISGLGRIYEIDGRFNLNRRMDQLRALAVDRGFVGATNKAEERNPSSTWTGRLDTKGHARVVLALAPAALQGLRQLIGEHEQRLHNHPPNPIGEIDIAALRELHDALAELICAAEAGEPLQSSLQLVRTLQQKTFRFAEDTYELCVAGIKPLLASTPGAFGTWTILNLISSSDAAAAGAVTVVGAHFGLALTSRANRKGSG